MALNVAVLALVIFLLPMFYLLLACPAFLLVRLDIPQVAWLLRTMFFGYFLTLVATGSLAAIIDALDGRLAQALFIGAVTAFVALWRGWMMPRIDALLAALQAGEPDVGSRLRRLHLTGMAANAAQLALVLGFIPSLVVTM